MLRRVALALRATLCLLGFALLVLLPFSFYFLILLHVASQEWERVFVGIQRGVLFVHQRDLVGPEELEVVVMQPLFLFEGSQVWPEAHRWDLAGTHVMYLSVPLWLLAAICLAWPVSSFLLARRRRRGRGFEVEARADSADSPDS